MRKIVFLDAIPEAISVRIFFRDSSDTKTMLFATLSDFGNRTFSITDKFDGTFSESMTSSALTLDTTFNF